MSTTPPAPKLFRDVLHAELDEIAESRRGCPQVDKTKIVGEYCAWPRSRENLAGIQLPHVKPQDAKKDHFCRARESELLGLAFSGGGIRSATFNLGILQGLAKYSLLPRFDYLSTVSGGGYIGSWFTAWIKRKYLTKVQEELAGGARSSHSPEPREINFLRQYSNYLTPKTGVFSADTWTMVSIYLRNLLLNLTILVFALGAGVALVRFLSYLTEYLTQPGAVVLGRSTFWWLLGIGTIALIFAAIFAFRNFMVLSEDCPRKPYTSTNYQGAVQWLVVIPILIAAWALSSTAISASIEWHRYFVLRYFVLEAVAIAVLALLISVLVFRVCEGKQQLGDLLTPSFIGSSALVSVIGGAVTGGGLFLLFPHLRSGFAHWAPDPRLEFLTVPQAQFIWGIPLVLALLLIGGTFYIGVMGDYLNAKHREWWARVGAWLHIYSLGWLAVSLVTLTGPWIVSQLDDWGRMAFTSGWLGTTIGGLLAGNSTATDKAGSNRGLELLAGLAPVVFVVGLLVVLSAAVNSSLTWGVAQSGWPALVVCLVALAAFSAVAVGLSLRVDINEFSMHHFYRDRLVRCYLGASNDDPYPHPFTGFDPIEHYLRISDLQCDPKDDEPRPDECRPKTPYVGPYYLVNTALNLVSGKNLAWQQRMATSFVFTPKHAGFAFLLPERKQLKAVEAFRPTEQYKGGVSLGSAVAISGAAASPNMGYHSSKALAFLMTVFNVRLGWWFGNPMKKRWDKPSPRIALFSLFSELFGFTNEDSKFVYLSDGGHFENLGIYELVRRRCRFIIACDGAQDGDLKFGDLGNAIEKCRTDLGIGININVDPIRCPANSKVSKRHCAVGTIHYEHVDPEAPQGILVYIKASLTGDEPTDVLRYSALNQIFPHQSTSDQFFDESQFESYRALGQHIVEEVLNGAGDTAAVHQMPTIELFLALKHYWYPSSVRVESHFSKHAAKVDAIYNELRTSRNLAFLSHQIYPEWRKLVAGKADCAEGTYWLPESCDEIREGFYICNQVIQLMEGVYVDLNLDQENDHPDNRGWMNFFRHWSWSGMFRVTWAISAATYGARFQTFCQRHLDLEIGEVGIGDEISGTAAKRPDWNDLEAKLVLNFYERQLIEKLITFDLERGLQKYSVYPLVLKVAIPTRPKESIDFHFGFALINATGERNILRFFRVQDHLRNMGLGRRGLTALMKQKRLDGLGIEGYPGDESKTQVEIAAEKAKGLVEEEDSGIRFPSMEERQLMRALFESVQSQREQEKEQKQERETEQKKEQEG
jgi:hypothetical protein